MVTHEHQYWTGSYNDERHSPANQSGTDDVYVTVEDGNDNASNSRVTCKVGLYYYANAASFEYSASVSSGTTFTGRTTLAFDLDDLTTTAQWFNHYVVECDAPGYDEDTSGIVAVRARYETN